MTPDRFELEKLYPHPAGPGSLPPGLADRITAAAVRDFRVRRAVRRTAWTASAAAVLVLVGWLAWPRPDRSPQADPVAKVIDPFREADSALASLSRSAADRVTSAGPALTGPIDLLPDPPPLPSTEATAALPAFQPVTDTATRAVGRFFKDLGSLTGTVRGGS
jgi:hypothetical protein